MATKPTAWTLCLFLVLFHAADGDKVAQKIYQDLYGIKPCVILTNATHQIGCTSSMNGHVGVLHYIQNKSDVEWIIEHGKHAPYVPLFRSDQFELELLIPLIKAKKISGALAIAVPSGKYRYTPKTGSSPDYACPSNGFGAYNGNKIYADCKQINWNRGGSGMSFRYFDIPMFALTDEKEVKDLLKCYQKYNSQAKPDYPLCAVQLKDFMYAAKDTPTCIRKTKMPNPAGSEFCQPLGDQNVWGTLYPIKEHLSDKRKVVMLAAKLDSSSFFHDLTPGVDNDGTGVIVTLAAAKLLGAMKRNGSIKAPLDPIMFTLFNGESWDYIGSSRMVYDMEHDDFPSGKQTWKKKFRMKTSDIKYFIEVNQVGLIENDGPLWVHSDPVSTNTSTKNQVNKLRKALEHAGKAYNLNVTGPPSSFPLQPLPPASFQRFLRSNKKIPGVVLTDHQHQYTNKFYNSHFDDLYQVRGNFAKENDTIYLLTNFTKKLAKITATVATALYNLANDDQPPKYEIKADNDTEAMIGHLAYCFFVRSNCPLYREVFSSKSWNNLKDYKPFPKPFPRYVSVERSSNTFTTAVYYLLLYFTGFHWPSKSAHCSADADEGIVNASMQGNNSSGICVTGTVHFSPAVSPAFLLEKYDSTEYSTWAESTWGDDLAVRLFLVASPRLEGATLAAGLIITLFSFGIVYIIREKADVLFSPINPLDDDVDS